MSKAPASPSDRSCDAQHRAADAPRDRLRLVLDPQRYDAFVATFHNLPEPGSKLTALLRRVPVWQK